MAKLLVSVRSKVEALAALAGGATIIDVKEPRNGPLGLAHFDVWREVCEVVTEPVSVSVALGELNDWSDGQVRAIPPDGWKGVTYRKLGLSHAPRDWIDRWQSLRRQSSAGLSSQPSWVAVVYIDWQAARAPDPESIIEAACMIPECQGVLFDTWEKSRFGGIDIGWKPQVDRVRSSGRFVAIAGSVDVEGISRLAPLAPDIFAVRGAACAGGDRLGPIDSARVSVLARAAACQGLNERTNDQPAR